MKLEHDQRHLMARIKSYLNLSRALDYAYMNSVLRKALYKRNMARNKFRQYGQKYWEENWTHRHKVVSLRKKSIATYFSKNCSKHDKTFWSTVSPFISDKNKRADSKIILQEGEETIVDNLKVANVFMTISVILLWT